MTPAGTTQAPARFTVLAAPGAALQMLYALGDGVEVREVASPPSGDVPDAPIVLLLTGALLAEGAASLTRICRARSTERSTRSTATGQSRSSWYP